MFPLASSSRILPRLTTAARHARKLYSIPRHITPGRRMQPQRRGFATPPPQVNVSNLSVADYNRLSDEAMDALVEDLEMLLDETGNPNYEVEYHSGVLTLKLGDEGTYVINKQPPNKQIWLSSPVSGPKRYDYSPESDSWFYSRDKRTIGELLTEELSKTFQKPIKLNVS